MKSKEENSIILPVVLPDDLLEEIMSRVRVGDLLRFRCVSKQWRTLIDDINFIKKQYNIRHSIWKEDGNMPHFVYQPHRNSLLYNFGLVYIQHQADVYTFDLTLNIERDSKYMLVCNGLEFGVVLIMGCVNGIVCLDCHTRNRNPVFLSLWNPATRDFKVVEYPNMEDLIYKTHLNIKGFGFDPVVNDFKIVASYDVATTNCNLPRTTCYVMYSLRSESWKRVNGPQANNIDGLTGLSEPYTDGYLNGVYYWTGDLKHNTNRGQQLVIISFNFNLEVFHVSDPPQDEAFVSSQVDPVQTRIGLYKESVAIFVTNRILKTPLYKIDIWIVTKFEEHGAPSAWQHLLRVEPIHAKLGVKVATSRIDGDLLLSFNFKEESSYIGRMLAPRVSYPMGSECCLLNPLTRKYKKLGINDYFTTWFRFVESLFPLSYKN